MGLRLLRRLVDSLDYLIKQAQGYAGDCFGAVSLK